MSDLLQVFLPYPFYDNLFDKERRADGYEPINLDFVPAFHDKSQDCSSTLARLIRNPTEHLKQGTHADTFGLVSLLCFLPPTNVTNLIENVDRFELVSGLTLDFTTGDRASSIFGDSNARTETHSAIASLTKNAERALTAGTNAKLNESHTNSFIRRLAIDLVENAVTYSEGDRTMHRVRSSLPGHSNRFGHFCELSFGSQQSSFASTIARFEDNNLLDERSRQLFEKLPDKDREALFFALLPGFSTSRGIQKPKTVDDNGMALFHLAQVARVAGALAIVSGNTVLELGKHESVKGYWKEEQFRKPNDPPNVQSKWKWWCKEHSLGNNRFPGVQLAVQLRVDMLGLREVIRIISLKCAQHFWQQTWPAANSVILSELYNKEANQPINNMVLKQLYHEYLRSEFSFLTDPISYCFIKNEILRERAGVNQKEDLGRQIDVVRQRLLNANYGGHLLDASFSKL